MKTESTVRPVTVERYPGLVRINWDVSEALRDDVTIYEYRMMELRGGVPGLDELVERLVSDKYPLEEQVRVLEGGSSYAVAVLGLYKHRCRSVALEVLGLPESLDFAKEGKVAELTVYDSSDAVNSFELLNGGVKVTDYWIGRDLRTSLKPDVEAAAKVGSTYNFDIRELKMTLPLDCGKFLAALERLRLYAVGCYNNTSRHIAVIQSLGDRRDVEGYDFTVGYPAKLSFDVVELM